MSTFDRYILRRFWHVFVVSFLAMIGLYVVIDAFSNIDNFIADGENSSSLDLLWAMTRFYGYRSCMFFDTIGSIVSITAVTVVLSLILRHGELNPILSAGIPTSRLLFPLLWGTVMVSSVIVINKELVIPRIAHELLIPAGKTGHEVESVEMVRDHATLIDISGEKIILAEKKLLNPQFDFPTSNFAEDVSFISGTEAVYVSATDEQPQAGWNIRDASIPYDDLKLTPAARKIVLRGEEPGDVFIVTEVGFENMYMPNKTVDLISTPELIRRIKSPTYDPRSVRSLSLHLHQRFTRPILSILLLFLVLPLIVRREARGLVVSMALAGFMQGVVFGLSQLFLWLTKSDYIGPDLAAWGPVIVTGTLATWFWPMLRT